MNYSPSTRQSSLSLSLPIVVTRETKLLYALLVTAFGFLFYLVPNHYPLTQPRLLPMSMIDSMVGFVPQTFWIYLSEYLLFVSVYLTCKDLENANKYFYAFFAMQFTACVTFAVWPTTFPRDQFPLIKETLDPITYWAFTLFRDGDSPNNCCPSLHVASVYLSSFVFIDEQRDKFLLFFLWASAIAVSTLTTKQHYFVDVVAGLSLAIVCWYVFHRVITYYRPNESRQPNL